MLLVAGLAVCNRLAVSACLSCNEMESTALLDSFMYAFELPKPRRFDPFCNRRIVNELNENSAQWCCALL